jgi:hypothetical protein
MHKKQTSFELVLYAFWELRYVYGAKSERVVDNAQLGCDSKRFMVYSLALVFSCQ